jgi:taurine dioxygenase
MLELRPLSSALGVEAVGLDLDAPLAPDEQAMLRAAYARGHLVLVRGGCVAMATQRNFAAVFGPVIDSAYVSNARPDGIIPNGALLFHSDLAFTPHPYLGLSLHALELPPSGSSTYFVDAVAAFRALPLTLRDRVQGLTGHPRVRSADAARRHARVSRARACARRPSAPSRRVHPPASGDGVLYVNEMQTERINELEREESDELIDALFAHLYSGEFTYEHRWQLGDLIVWGQRRGCSTRAAIRPMGHARCSG